jgi:hypothetical protein
MSDDVLMDAEDINKIRRHAKKLLSDREYRLKHQLLGDVSAGGLGTGLIPLDNIVGFTNSRGISGFVDTVTLRRETGGSAIISLG